MLSRRLVEVFTKDGDFDIVDEILSLTGTHSPLRFNFAELNFEDWQVGVERIKNTLFGSKFMDVLIDFFWSRVWARGLTNVDVTYGQACDG